MQVTTIDHVDLDPGRFLRWTLGTTGPGPDVSPVPPSFNQLCHLDDTGDGSVWLAATFDIPGHVDEDALARAFTLLITRHGSLRSAFERTADGGVRRLLFATDSITLERREPIRTSTAARTREVLWTALNRECHPFATPAYLLAALDRPDRSTVVCGFDHAYIDAYSVSLIVHDLHRLYRACLAGDTVDAPTAGDFVDYCAEEWTADIVELDDSRMQSWLSFFGRHGNTPPPFPLELGVAVGTTHPQAAQIGHLLGPDATRRFEEFCRANGASLYAGVLSAMAHAVRRLGGGDRLSLLFPLHTRTDERWQSAVGWFTTNAPLDVLTADDFVDTVRSTGPALRTALTLGSVPLPQVIEAMGTLNRSRRDVFMVSYVDYRRLPGHEDHRNLVARHISNVTVADDAQFWISRTEDGLALRSRFPDTPVAREVVTRFLAETSTVLAEASAPQPVTSVVH
ncbi:condensation domain-containing protein [Actinomycetes bacterium M1A6_2h]